MAAQSALEVEAAPGFRYYPGFLSSERASALATEVLALIERAPFYRPRMPRTGQPLRNRMTNLGPLGWISDVSGYRYAPKHPETGEPWPEIPKSVRAIWDELADYPHPPEACLVNYYEGEQAKLGLHIDADELAVNAPVVSISLGDTALFRLGGPERKSPTQSLRLSSGDVVVLGGASRRFYHGVDRIYPGTSRLIPGGGRINLTLRRVNKPS
ncbi:MAG: alpha-ketoglutarate-dependent dioxygenase AlkB [Alphaproteobacteria bacterium]